MEVRSDFVGTTMSSASAKVNSVSSGSRRSKKRTSRRSNGSEAENRRREEEEVLSNRNQQISSLDYRPIFWQRSGVPSHVQTHNGQQQQQPQQQQQRLFAAVSDPSVCGYSAVPMAYTMEPLSVPPIYPLYQPITRPNYRNYRVRAGRNLVQNNRAAAAAAAAAVSRNNGYAMSNGYSSLQDNATNYSNHIPAIYQNGDYASLPPSGNNDNIEDGEEINSEHRRYSDPGLGPAADLPPTTNSGEDSDSAESTGSSITTIGKNNKLVLSLVEQMTALRETNSQMFKELHEAKSDLENVKSELARLKHSASSDYQPGMLSDIVREMREANKILDEAMITKVNAMIEDHNRQRTMEFEKLQEQLRKVSEEKENGYRRISKLEEEVAALKLNTKNEDREIAAFEEETITLRRDLQEARASRNIAESHASKLEKLVGILRKKMNGGASDEDTTADIRDLVTSGLNRHHHPQQQQQQQQHQKKNSLNLHASNCCSSTNEERPYRIATNDGNSRDEVDVKPVVQGKQEEERQDEEEDEDEEEDDDEEDLEEDETAPNSKENLDHGTTKYSVASNANESLTGPVTDL